MTNISITKNIFWNALRIGSNLLFPLITFPYTARILGPEIKGEFEYINAVVGYFILFANLGFPMYGIREVSNNRDSIQRLSRICSSIFTANLLTSLIAFFVYIIGCYYAVSDSLSIYLIIGISIPLSCIQFDWFYQGIEDFRYITIRSLIVRTLSLIALFIFVKSSDDLIPYAIITVIATLGNNVYNYNRIRKLISLRLNLKGCLRHIKGSSVLFLATIIVSLYTTINTVMLGLLDSNESVGYFTASNKLIHLVLMVITATLSVVLPRISYHINSGDKDSSSYLQYKVLHIMLRLCIPLTIAIYILSPDIIYVMAGQQYIASIPLLQILSFIILFITLSDFFGNHILYTAKKESKGNICAILGTICNILLNLILIKKYGCLGVAVSTVCAEFIVTTSAYFFARKHLNLPLRIFIPKNILIAISFMVLILHIANTFFHEYNIYTLIIKTLLGSCIYLGVLVILRDSLTLEILQKIKK